ncbi:hypothetical protein [Halocatena pleomorpha]|uniref:Uncharacterized protein n=1 Tax=Halocatena pleomorpha TaxID=1785090 RepID=A0A3P3R7N8_9EURY|nr:hypothetical protein [Halocatena pleomorpha]RRJ29481.1 hypothetical protein EIK79_12635 [Halocatena pleomorpha]
MPTNDADNDDSSDEDPREVRRNDTERAKQDVTLGRRDLMKAGSVAGLAALVSGGLAASTGSVRAVAPISAESVDTGNYPGLISPNGDRSVTVDKTGGGDYTSIQAAVDNEVYMFMRDALNINLQSSQTYNEDVTIPAYLPAEIGEIETGGQIDINGGGAEVKSLTCFGATGIANPHVGGINFVGTSPYTDDQASVVAQGASSITVKDCDFLPTTDRTDRNYCIVYYTITGGKIGQCTLRNYLYQGIRLKRWGNAEIQYPTGNADAAREGEGELVRCSHGMGWVRHNQGPWEGEDIFYVRGGQGVDADNGITYFNGGSVGP